jgi:CRP-like cAMP-binding protein
MAESRAHRLRKIPFFANLSEADLFHILRVAKDKSYLNSDIIIKEKTLADAFYIIESGKVEIAKRFDSGEEMVLDVQEAGNFFGEMALLDSMPRSATARALEPTKVLEITKRDFEALLTHSPLLGYRMMKELSARLRDTRALLIAHLQ